MYYKKVPNNFSICTFGYKMFSETTDGIEICKVFEELHKVYHFSFKSLKEKIHKEIYEEEREKWYATRTSEIFLFPRERKVMPKHNNQWISHYFRR